MHFPVRKCYHAVKICLLLVLVVSILALFEQWRGGKRSALAQFSDPLEAEYERQILEDEARIIPGLGEGGVAAHLMGEDQLLGEESEKKLAINVHLSERIAYNRTLKDYRNPACARVVYDAELPSASVILIFHNEPYSVVVRTVWSVVNSARRDRAWYKHANFVERGTGRLMSTGYPGQDPSSPFVYLKEIILVDDNSTLPELKGKLSHYVRTRLPPDLIRILRLPDRVGLTRARLAGARYAAGDVLVFLDSHCEGQPDWLRPMLQRVKDDPHAVVVPIIDVIDSSNFYYSVQDQVTFQGLMVARVQGAKAARGDVLIFLDAHCEVGSDWLRPLLQRTSHKRDAVLTPLIDVVDQSTFQLDAAEHFQVGGFTFMGHFTWIEVPEREKKRRGSDIAPTWSPTMAGGLFAINRAYYWELGAYDEQMAGWGGENLEMSFRIWQCGGTLETIPCSRVGHVFRSFHPYGLPAHSDTHGINTARMAEVWMDEYAELFYLHRPDLRKNPKIGDVTHRKILREKLKCKSFQWYLDNIYKEKFVPVRDVYGYGRFSNPATNMCLDTLQREGGAVPLGVYPCHSRLQATQYLSLSARGELRSEETCAELQRVRDEPIEKGRRVLMSNCHGKTRGQKWRYLPSAQIQHVDSGLCLDAGFDAGADVLAAACKPDAPAQRWKIDYNEDNNFRLNKDEVPTEQEQRLSKLRVQRRISRSLLSFTEEPTETPEPEANVTIRRHTHKKRGKKHTKKRSRKKRTKNKFILKLVRTLANNSEEHLEVDIHCNHKKLYPNNSFVRDLVTVLNDRDIKVINNGRVFERNKVTELRSDKVLHKLDVPQPTGKPTKHGRSKKRKPVQPVAFEAEPGPAPAPAPEPASAPTSPAPEPSHKKIIIEDFVEIAPTTQVDGDLPPVRAHKRRKRKKKRFTTTTEAARALSEASVPRARQRAAERDALLRLWDAQRARDDTDENRLEESSDKAPAPTSVGDLLDKRQLLKMQKVASDEDSLKVEPPSREASGERARKGDGYIQDNMLERDRSDEEWQMGESRFRSKNDTVRRAAPERAHDEEKKSPRIHLRQHKGGAAESLKDQLQEQYERGMDTDTGDASPPPSRKQGGGSDAEEARPVKLVMRSNLTFNLGDEFFSWRSRPDSVAELLGELSIPSNSTRAAPPAHAWLLPPRGRHEVITATAAALLRSDSDDEDSSSSDSSSD